MTHRPAPAFSLHCHSERVPMPFIGTTRNLLLLSTVLLVALFPQTLRAQIKPLATIQLDCRASAISSQGLTACVAFHQMHFQKYTI